MIDVCSLAALQLKERLHTFPWKMHGIKVKTILKYFSLNAGEIPFLSY